MINNDKIKIYKKYNGDIDSWVRNGSRSEKSTFNDNDWYLINNFLQEIDLVKNKLASKEFENKLNDKLNKFCENSQVIDFLKNYSIKIM